MQEVFTYFDRFLWGCKQFITITGVSQINKDFVLQSLGDKNPAEIEAVIIGKGVRILGANTFKNWSSLRRVWLGPDVTEIGTSAFYNCRKLELFTYDTGLQTKFSKRIIAIGDRAFYGVGLTDIAYLHVNELGTGVFENSTIKGINTVVGIDAFPEQTFKGCKNLTSPFIIKQNIVRCYDFFLEDSSIESIIFDNQPSLFISSRALGNSKVKQVTFRTYGEIIWDLPLLTAQTLCVSVFPNSPAHAWAVSKHVTHINFIDK